MNTVCRICNNSEKNDVYILKEAMFGTQEKFDYFQCSCCDTIQIAEIPEDIEKYYPNNYYSFNNKHSSKGFIRKITSRKFIRKIRSKQVRKHHLEKIISKYYIRWRLGKFDIIGWLSSLYKKFHPFVWLNRKYCSFDSKILDVGCGSGTLLFTLRYFGFKSLVGIDPFIPKSTSNNHVRILKKEIFDLDESFDFIMLHHSFEHMDEPHKVLTKLHSILNNNGTLLIRIPIADCFAWEEYKENWFQLDPPRHFFLYSKKSMDYLANEHGFRIDLIICDSTEIQFVASEGYRNGISLMDITPVPKRDRKMLRRKAILLNKELRGDQACFFLKKK